jgi:cellulose synthase/poly-beta-1,6-N-acetylglucosamine synthase-like glycosyltransferase
MLRLLRFLRRMLSPIWTIITSGLTVGILLFIIINFYIFSSIVNLNSFFYAFMILSLLTDGLFIFLHLPRRAQKQDKLYFDPTKVTIVISSYNGQDVIEETVRNANKHVPLDQIIVLSDASTDNTAEVARKTGARVIVNKHNLHKVRSLNEGIKQVKTPYVLILDDDTLIGETFIPTSLLDDGYTAVAFNVMPLEQKTIINELQRFEYRATMQLAKQLRASVGAIGNISGAIGLYRTSDLRKQFTLHSGQFAGEDEQRALLVHMYGEGKGIAYTSSLVVTKAPETYKALFKQRAYSWSLAVPELFFLYMRVLFSTKFHYTLKAEKAYQVYIYLTDPLRILFAWTLIMRPRNLVLMYAFYSVLNILIWLRLGTKDSLRSVLLTPVYTLALTVCRFIGYFYWFRVKAQYLAKRLHAPVAGRHLLLEYCFVGLIVIGSWGISVVHFRNDLNLFKQIQTERLNDNDAQFSYDFSSDLRPADASNDTPKDNAIAILMSQGDNPRAIAHKAVDEYAADNRVFVAEENRRQVDQEIAKGMQALPAYEPSTYVPVSKELIRTAIMHATPTTGGAQR